MSAAPGDDDVRRAALPAGRQHCDGVGRDLDEIVVSASIGLHDGVPAALRTCTQREAAGAQRVILALPLPDRSGTLGELVSALS